MMMVIAQPPAQAGRGADRHYCPHCLRRVAGSEARRQAHREPCRSGALDVFLLTCPTCGLVLSAEVTGAAPPRSQYSVASRQ